MVWSFNRPAYQALVYFGKSFIGSAPEKNQTSFEETLPRANTLAYQATTSVTKKNVLFFKLT